MRRRPLAPGALRAALERLPAAVHRWLAIAARRRVLAEVRALREAHFSAAYDAYRLSRLGAFIGPLNLFHSSCYDLLLSYIGTRSAEVPWLYVFRTGGSDLFYRIGIDILRLRRPGRSLLASRRWRMAARQHQELPWWLPSLVVPRQLHPNVLRSLRRQLLDRLSRGGRGRRMWLRERLRIVRGPSPTLARQTFGMAAACRSCVVAELLDQPARMQDALNGTDLERIKEYWKVSIPATVPQL